LRYPERARRMNGGKPKTGTAPDPAQLIGPFALQDADERLRLAVRSGCVGLGAQVPDLMVGERRLEVAAAVAGAVVGHHPFDRDAALREPCNDEVEEADAAGGVLARVELADDDAGVVVDRDVGVLPAGAGTAADTVVEDPLADPEEPAQLLGVEMDQRTGLVVLV